MKTRDFGKRSGWAVLALIAAAGLSACLVPPFAELQDARLAGQGKVELTPFASTVSQSNEGETAHAQNDFGIQAGVGLASFLDLRLRYEYIAADSDTGYEPGYGVHVVGIGPKFSLVKDRLAFSLPVGFAIGEGLEPGDTIQIHPTLIATAPLGKGVAATLSAKALIPLYEGGTTHYAVNLGFGFTPGSGPVTIRPEAGLLFGTGGQSFAFHFSLGCSFRLGR